jgi:hypothetical protein
MSADKQKPKSVPNFSSEHEEADWWASPEGRRFLKSQPPQSAAKSGRGSERVTRLARATNAEASPAVPIQTEPADILEASFNRYLSENDPSAKTQAGRDLISSIFGKDSLVS